MGVRYEKHLLNLMQLLEANDAYLAGAWGWFEDKAELALATLCHQEHISSH